MSDVYAIRNREEFQQLELEIDDLLDFSPDEIPFEDIMEFHLRNTAMKSWWKKPHTRFIDSGQLADAPIPDISHWTDSTLLLSPRANDLLGDLLQLDGELLPVQIDDQTFQIFNCFTVGDADEDQCSIESHEGMSFGIERLVFQPDVEDLLIWKTPIESCLTLYCGDRFKDVVESLNLSGIRFDSELVPFASMDMAFDQGDDITSW